jgi:predicted dehydrogenase
MPEKVRVGVIGTSWWADMMHLPCLKSRPRASLVAICGRNRVRTEELARKYGVQQVFTDYRELRQAQEMCGKAESADVTNMVMFTHRWWPHIALIKKLLEEQTIGRCHHCSIQFMWDYGREPRYEWRFDRRRSNGVLGDMCSHSIDLARWFCGDVVKVAAHLGTYVERPGPGSEPLDPAWDSALLALEFENGAHGSIHSSYVSFLGNRMFELRVTIHGISGTIESTFSALTAEVTLVTEDRKKPETTAFPRYVIGDAGPEAFPRMWDIFTELPVGDRLFIDCVTSGRPAEPSFSDGLKVQEIIDGADRSNRTGRWVSL